VTPDLELIARTLTDDDRAAFGELVRRHQSAVRQFLRHLTRDAALADDLAQETFVQAYRSLARFRGDSAFTTWLLGIAHNRWRNARRRLRPASALPDDLPDHSEKAPSRTADLKHDLALALRALTRDEQLAIQLGYQQGLSHSDMAALLQWPVGTVKTHLARAKEKLRHHLAAWNPQI
jgi:RNA polymerase sigma-70 factor (ECF subfamily)